MSTYDNSDVLKLRTLLGERVIALIGEDNFIHGCNAYLRGWRHYHGITHPIYMLGRRNTFTLRAQQSDLIGLMVFYHDVWRKVGRRIGENEEMSARWAGHDLIDCVTEATLKAVQWGIRSSVDHTVVSEAPPEARQAIEIFLDLDLARLGESEDSFLHDVELVWLEHEPHFTREEFNSACGKWAQHILNRPKIFLTEYFASLEAQARYNVGSIL